jgi:cytoskeletal protein CcmA (bactofilin family)
MAFNIKSDSDGSGSGLNLIGRGTVIIGSITSNSSIRVEGEIRGQVVSKDLVTIGNTGIVEGDVEAKNVVVGGKVEGNLTAQDKLVLEAKCSVTGDVRARRLVIDEGALFEGQCAMGEVKESVLVKETFRIQAAGS